MAGLRNVSLSDKYELSSGTVLLSGTQALVKLALMQRALDARRGRNTAGYISGYRGSPLGGLDQQLWRAQHYLDGAGIRFDPGVNEDLAATAVWGTQQAPLLPGARVQGVFALWYGKGPGLDRSGDPIKHGNRMGTTPLGGVLLAVGDDHAGKSSTVAYQSEPALAANGVPVLYPATVQEYLDFGLLGWALSRHCGLWVALKCVNDTVETTATVDVDLDRAARLSEIELPPPSDVHARIAFDPVGDDVRLQRQKLPAAQQFARAGRLDRIILGSPHRKLSVVAAGKSFLDTLAALRLLGIDAARAATLGIGLYKPGMIWPLEPQGMREFARGSQEVLVVEEKAAFLEPQIAHALFNLRPAERPRLFGKLDDEGRPLLPADVGLDSSEVALAIANRLSSLGVRDREVEARTRAILERRAKESGRLASPVKRAPYFCSGCPHNTSTRVPEGSLALSGIGCHTMAMGMNRHTLPPTHMGGEGMTWAGIAPFTSMSHVFQNLGDGTYFHSGLLAVRAAVAAKVNITYKLLVNDAVAMTGGQPVEGNLTLPEMSRQLAAEKVRRIAVVSDAPERWRSQAKDFAPGVSIHHRDELETLQRELRGIPGVTAILYEQTCAAEKRRRRKRGLLPDPPRRIFINAQVCEGCGDCSEKSNCLSVEPLETELGRKRRIDQSSCNKDYSCSKGFCPSFVLVEGARVRRPAAKTLDPALFTDLPEPPTTPASSFAALIGGIGGTGVVTIGAVLAMAAHLEAKRASVFDMTGLAQKGGAVFSHLRIDSVCAPVAPPTIESGAADLLLACDLVVATGAEALRAVSADHTQLLVNTCVAPVAQFQQDRDFDFQTEELLARARGAVRAERYVEIPATQWATRVLGDSIATNMLMTGFAYQSGRLPVSAAAIERAIELNGTAVELNLNAFRLGRLFRHDPSRCARLAPDLEPPAAPRPMSLDALIDHRARLLAQYQDEAYAQRFRAFVANVREAERAVVSTESLTQAVAWNYYKLLAYKDEYEVARLYTTPEFHESLAAQFEGTYRVRLLLAPPLFAGRDPLTGEPRKMVFNSWVLPLLRLLAAGRRLRGTPLDVFGYSRERRMERDLIEQYEDTLATVLKGLSAASLAAAVALARLPESIRGFGPVKSRSAAQVRARWKAMLDRYVGASDSVA